MSRVWDGVKKVDIVTQINCSYTFRELLFLEGYTVRKLFIVDSEYLVDIVTLKIVRVTEVRSVVGDVQYFFLIKTFY